jgi:hypothetical protein
MPSKVVLISWDVPSDRNWLAEDNIALALHAYCPNTEFKVYPEEAIAVVKEEERLERRAEMQDRLTMRETDSGDSPTETELSNDELDSDYQLWANQ